MKYLFEPFVGEKYPEGYNGTKILVLGESHYCNEDCKECDNFNIKEHKGEDFAPECRDFTQNVVANRFLKNKKGEAEHESWMTTYTKFTNFFHGEQVDEDTLLTFWDSIVFYNYIQRAMTGPRQAPRKEDFSNSEDSFFTVLKEYKPDVIIVWGEGLGNNLPSRNYNEEKEAYNVDGKSIAVLRIWHPASSKSYKDYGDMQAKMQAAIKKAKS